MSGADGQKGERLRALAVLVALSGCFLWWAYGFVPRLNNLVMSDMEFTGWSGPIASRVLAGERPYVDFVLPIPPGSFVVLAAIQRIAGRPLLLQELWLNALIDLALGWLAYAIAARFTTRLVAVMTAAATLVTVVQLPKECAYDHTAQLVAWSSVALGAHALFALRRRAVLFALTGWLAGVTLLFKQSTATGVLGGWVLGLGYLAIVAWRARDTQRLALIRGDARAWALGALGGFVVLWGVLLALGTSLSAYVRCVFLDAPDLKGGTLTIAGNLLAYVGVHDAFPSSLALTVIAVAVGFRLRRLRGGLHLGDEAEPRASLDVPRAVLVVCAAAACFGGAAALLASEARALPAPVLVLGTALKSVPTFGLLFALACFVAHLLGTPAGDDPTGARRWGGHLLNAMVLVTFASTLLHDTSFVVFKPFYQNNPTIPLAFLLLFAVVLRSRLGWFAALLFAGALGGMFGLKLDRALSADTPVTEGHWAGLRVNYRGREIVAAARRVRELTSPDDTVLVLPEDVQLAALIDRRRPPLRGAIVFVDQYARRLAADDIRTLEAQPPRVIVRHPRRERDWRRLFGTWREDCGAADVLVWVEKRLLPSRYTRDSSFPTIYFWDQGQLDIWVRRDAAGARP